MNKLVSRLFLIALLSFVAAGPELPRHLLDAKTLVAHIAPGQNDYQHKNCYIHWPGENGASDYENHTDCSDLLNLLLEHSYGITSKQLKEWTGSARPVASVWHDAILTGKVGEQIKFLQDAKPGDVLAIKFPPNLPDTGHIMLIAELPLAIEAKPPVVPDTHQWDVTVIDSSKSGHGPTDTRYISQGVANPGVGRGVIRIYTDPDGQIAGYTWSDFKNSRFEPMNERHMVIGRLKLPG